MVEQPEHALKSLKFAYMSAIVIIVLLLTSAQILIQASLQEETQTRANALLIGTQSLRLQALELEALNLADKTQNVTQNILIFRATESVWEQTHQQMQALSLSADERAKLQAVQPFYLAIQTGARSLIALEGQNGKNIASMSKAEKEAFTKGFLAIFYSLAPDLRGLVYINQSLNFEADTYVAEIRLIELALFGLSMLTLLAEYAFVVRPANKRLRWQVAQMRTA
jgi:hypothetical protein